MLVNQIIHFQEESWINMFDYLTITPCTDEELYLRLRHALLGQKVHVDLILVANHL